MSGEWVKVDAHLDTHPKIIAAGFWGSVVFQWVLRVNYHRGWGGNVPGRFMCPGNVSTSLRLDVADLMGSDPLECAKFGVAQCVKAELLELMADGDTYRIIGFDQEWGAVNPSTLRSRRRREKLKAQKLPEQQEQRPATSPPLHTVAGDEKRHRRELRATNETPSVSRGSLSKAHELWQEQERRRTQLKVDGVDTGIRVNLLPGEAHLAAVRAAAVLYGLDACGHALECADAEARIFGHARYFDGRRNWSDDSMRHFGARELGAVKAEAVARRDREANVGAGRRGVRPEEPIRKIKRLDLPEGEA